MTDLSIKLPDSFLEPKVLSGYLVSEQRKAIWAVELDLLEQFIQVCKKHDLQWFALGGTLLGAVRHHGFIPWDDDIDLIMPREDYDKLLEVGPEEFKPPYFFQCTLTENKFWRTHVQIRNSNTTGAILTDSKKKINRGIFIDVMVLDEVPESKKERDRHRKMINKCRRLKYVDKMRVSANALLRGVGNGIAAVLGNQHYQKNFRKVNQICAQYKGTGTSKVAHTTLSYREVLVWNKKDYAQAIPMDFEFLKINVPIGYGRILSTQFGNKYMDIPAVHPNTAHGVLIVDTDTPYEQYFAKQREAMT